MNPDLWRTCAAISLLVLAVMGGVVLAERKGWLE